MTRSLHSRRWQRIAALAVASVLLHYAAVNWVGARLAAPVPSMQRARAPIAPIVAELRLTQAPDAGPVPGGAAPLAKRAPPAGVVVKKTAARGYQLRLPPSADLTFDLTRVDARGDAATGQGAISWQRAGGSYRLTASADITGMQLWALASEGAVGRSGIAPRTMTEQRRGRSPVALHFNAAQRQITFSASPARVDLLPGAQDSATFPVQLAGIAGAGRAQLARGIEMLVAGGRDAQRFRFVLAGEEEIDTGMGRMMAWRVQRPAPPGSYNAHLEIWLAPDHHWYPVQLRSTEANGTRTTQTIRRIIIKEN